MNCSCIYVDTGDSGAEIFTAANPKANRMHQCSECKRRILVGEVYRRETGCWKGFWSTYKTCADCLSIRDAMFCEGYHYTMLWEYVENYINDSDGAVSTECLMELTPAARDKVMAMMDEVFREEDQDA